MPRTKRRAKSRQKLLPNQVRMLTFGVALTEPGWGTWVKPRDRQATQAAWDEYRSELMEDWIRQHPCTRPIAFYQWDAVEPRQRVVRAQPCEASDSHKSDFRLSVGFGGLNSRLGAENTYGREGEFETEREYLVRIEALTPTELESL